MMEARQYVDWFKTIIGAGDGLESEPISQEEIEEMKKKLQSEYQAAEHEAPDPGEVRNTGRMISEYVGTALQRIVTARPESLEECNRILDQLRERTAVVVNFEHTEHGKAVQMINYLCGGVYVLRGRAVKVNGNIIVFLSENVELAVPDRR